MSYNHYESYSVQELWEKLVDLASEHCYDDDLDDHFGNKDYSITHIKCIAEEISNRLHSSRIDDEEQDYA